MDIEFPSSFVSRRQQLQHTNHRRTKMQICAILDKLFMHILFMRQLETWTKLEGLYETKKSCGLKEIMKGRGEWMLGLQC